MRKPLALDFDETTKHFNVWVAFIRKSEIDSWELEPYFFPTHGHALHNYAHMIKGDWKIMERGGYTATLKHNNPLKAVAIKVTQLICPEWIDEDESDLECTQSAGPGGVECSPRKHERR